ncbi:MAG: hypothetical protein RH942_12220 [Kiloniellaceae bacterium]
MLNEATRVCAVSGVEPTLGEVFDDTGIRLLMARDGVARSDVELLIQATRKTRLAALAGL